jgi:hypothetical protein
LQRPYVPGDAVVRIVTAEHLIEATFLSRFDNTILVLDNSRASEETSRVSGGSPPPVFPHNIT